MVQASPLPEGSLTKTRVLVDGFLESCQKRGLSADTVRFYRGFLVPFAEQYPEPPSGPSQIEDFVGSYHTSDERRHGCFRALRVFYNFVEDRHGAANPMTKMTAPRRLPKVKRGLSKEEIKRLLEFPGHPPEIRAILYFLADTGARIGEVANLTGADIYETSVKITGKTGSRVVPVSPIVRSMLVKLGPGPLWNKSKFWLIRSVSKAFEAAGFPGMSAHSLRHSFAQNWRGSDLALKTMGGWASMSMVEHYAGQRPAMVEKEHAQYSPLARGW